MAFTFFNTLGREKQLFTPLREGKVGFYGCGPTVYNYAHIGNLRAYVLHDVLVRSLRRAGFDVNHVMNITDVGHLSDDSDDGEDKMVKSAEERGKSVLEIADFYTQAFFKDTGRMNITRPTIVCKATEHIADMIALIERIEKNGFTYFAGGNLYFDISKFPSYGELALLRLDDLKAGARIEQDENKISPAGLEALNRLLSSVDGLKALANIAVYLRAGDFRFADGAKTVRVEAGTFSAPGQNLEHAFYLTADMTKAIARDEVLRLLDSIKTRLSQEELEAARAEFRADTKRRKGSK